MRLNNDRLSAMHSFECRMESLLDTIEYLQRLRKIVFSKLNNTLDVYTMSFLMQVIDLTD